MCLGTCVSSNSLSGVGGEFQRELAPRGIARNPSNKPGNPPLGHHPVASLAVALGSRDPAPGGDSPTAAPLDDATKESRVMTSFSPLSPFALSSRFDAKGSLDGCSALARARERRGWDVVGEARARARAATATATRAEAEAEAKAQLCDIEQSRAREVAQVAREEVKVVDYMDYMDYADYEPSPAAEAPRRGRGSNDSDVDSQCDDDLLFEIGMW